MGILRTEVLHSQIQGKNGEGQDQLITQYKVQSIMKPKTVRNFYPQIDVEVKHIVELLASVTESEGSVNPEKLLKLLSLNVVLATMTGLRAESLDDPLATQIIYYIEGMFQETGTVGDITAFLPILSYIDRFTGIQKRYEDITTKGRDIYFGQMIQEALNSDRDCLIKELYKIKEEGELDEYDLLVTIGDIIGGATDTTATSLSWGIATLCHYPDVQKRIAGEIDAFIKEHGRLANVSDRDAFPYTLCVIKECLRSHCVGPFGVPHAASEDFEYKGYHIPKGATVLSNLTEQNKSSNRYENPHMFNPERYADDHKSMGVSAVGSAQERDHYSFGWG
ncbi:hypothetical protein DFQ28_010303, partial [Apophysomyces sp. BC1034]